MSHRRRGIFEGLPRLVYRHTGERYLDAFTLATPLNGVAVSAFGLVTLALYVELSAGELAGLAAVWAAAHLVEGALAALYLHRDARPVREWLHGVGGEEAAWPAAAELPVRLVRRPSLYVVGAIGAAALCAVAGDVRLFPLAYLIYVSSVILRFIALELSMRPLLEVIPAANPPRVRPVSLHRRLLVTVPMVTWGASVVVGGLLTENTTSYETVGLASVVAVGVTAAVSMWLGLVLADSVAAPIVDLRDATRRVGQGDLSVRVPVVSTDETGELSASFNAMVAGLGERERLRAAFGTFVDPALTERVLAEGIDLRGEEVDATVLFLDVRAFTEFTESAGPHAVVARLNELYEVVVPVISRHGGHALKFIGDGLMAVFGTPERHADHAARAVAAACEIAGLVGDGAGGGLRAGVGVSTGRVVVGTIGGGARRDFTVIGDPVNTAARVEAATRATGDDVLITDSTLRALGDGAGDFEERPSLQLKGKTAPVRVYAPRWSGG